MNQLSRTKQPLKRIMVALKSSVKKLAIIGLVLTSFVPSLISYQTQSQNPETINGFQDQSATLIEKI